jgi:hypothetical protein
VYLFYILNNNSFPVEGWNNLREKLFLVFACNTHQLCDQLFNKSSLSREAIPATTCGDASNDTLY